VTTHVYVWRDSFVGVTLSHSMSHLIRRCDIGWDPDANHTTKTTCEHHWTCITQVTSRRQQQLNPYVNTLVMHHSISHLRMSHVTRTTMSNDSCLYHIHTWAITQCHTYEWVTFTLIKWAWLIRRCDVEWCMSKHVHTWFYFCCWRLDLTWVMHVQWCSRMTFGFVVGVWIKFLGWVNRW